MTSRYLNPKIDLAFKRLFGEHKNLLRSFLNAMLPLPEGALIESLEYLSPEQIPEIPGVLKYTVVDVKCTDARGRIFIVEMQMMRTHSFESRIVFGASQAYVTQLRSAKDYRELQPVYALALLNQSFIHDSDEYYHHYKIVRVGNGDMTPGAPSRVLKGLEFVLVELPKFKPTGRTERQMQALWLRFLNEIGDDDSTVDADMLNNADIAQALDVMEQANLTPAQLAAYHVSLDRARTETSVSEDLRDEGRVQGRAEGLAIGEAKGKAEGKAEGEAKAILAMSRSGMPAEQVAQIMSVSVDYIAQLIDQASDGSSN